jgi:type II secretory ATPase GspE/PulE/Tfp pilus assembly ATPase PilB-like protein
MTWMLLTTLLAVLFALFFLRGRRHVSAWPSGSSSLGDGGYSSADVEIVEDGDCVKAINDILRDVKEHGASAVHIGVLERSEEPAVFSARYLRGDEVVQSIPLPMEWREKITRRLKIMTGLHPWPDAETQEGRLRIHLVGASLQEFSVTFHPEETGGEILLKVSDVVDTGKDEEL